MLYNRAFCYCAEIGEDTAVLVGRTGKVISKYEELDSSPESVREQYIGTVL